jgi:hypothetical protein
MGKRKWESVYNMVATNSHMLHNWHDTHKKLLKIFNFILLADVHQKRSP